MLRDCLISSGIIVLCSYPRPPDLVLNKVKGEYYYRMQDLVSIRVDFQRCTGTASRFRSARVVSYRM